MADPASESSAARAKGSNGPIPDDEVYTWRTLFSILAGKTSPEGMEQYRIARDDAKEASDCKRCDDHKRFLFQYSPVVRFMRENINKLHGDINEDNVRCRRCTVRREGGFSPKYGIEICANEMLNRNHVEDTLAHEMVHAYDHLRFKVDWADLRHAACSEIRASTLSGECRWAREVITRGQWKLTRQMQECVRRRAILSVQARPTCKDTAEAAKVVNEVWDSCFTDTRPFDEIYR